MIILLAVIIVSSAVSSGVAVHIAATKKNSEIFMSPDETYKTTGKWDHLVLKAVCMEVPLERSETHWDLIKGDSNVHSTTTVTQYINGTATEYVGYLFYLLEKSTISAELQGIGYFRIYEAKDISEVSNLEQKCLNGDEQAFSHCKVEQGTPVKCETTIEYPAAHYYVCIAPTPDTQSQIHFSVTLTKVQYNTSEYETCDDGTCDSGTCDSESAALTQNSKTTQLHHVQCCKLSLKRSECVFVSATCEDPSFLHSPVNVTLTAHGRKYMTVSLVAFAVILSLGLIMVVSMYALACYKFHHQDRDVKGFHITI